MESQLDWLTATCSAAGDQMAFLRLGESLVEQEHERGNTRRLFAQLGYRGSHAGRASYGCRADGSIISLSGDLAATAFDGVYPIATHVSRVDVAVTVVLNPPVLDIETECFDGARLAPAHEGRDAATTLIRNRDGSASFMLGKRSSERFLRVYNKDIESGEARYRGAHRYEVELKAHQAGEVARCVHLAADRPGWVQSFVHAHCTSRGVLPVFASVGDASLVPGFRRQTDIDGSLRWITASVAPSVRRILAANRATDLVAALGLDSPSMGRILASAPPGVT